MFLLTCASCSARSCSLGFHQEIVVVLLYPPVLPTCRSFQLLASSLGGPPCCHLFPFSHPGRYGRKEHSHPGTPSTPARFLPSVCAGLSSLQEHCPGWCWHLPSPGAGNSCLGLAVTRSGSINERFVLNPTGVS